MKFHNPWIDPRIVYIRADDVQAYLARTGWQQLGPASNPDLLRYERTDAAEDGPTLFVPVRTDGGAALQWMIDLVGDLARFENRWAVTVLNEILKDSATLSPNNSNVSVPIETALK